MTLCHLVRLVHSGPRSPCFDRGLGSPSLSQPTTRVKNGHKPFEAYTPARGLRKGVPWFLIYNLVLALPMFVLLAVALLAYKLEGRIFTWRAVQDRFRLWRMDLYTWLWAAALSVFMYGGRVAIFISFGLALIALIMEKRTGYKSIWPGAGGVAFFFFLSWSLWQTEPSQESSAAC